MRSCVRSSPRISVVVRLGRLANVRESRSIPERPQRALIARYTPLVEAFDIADVEITVDGETIRLGDFWPIARFAGEGSLRG